MAFPDKKFVASAESCFVQHVGGIALKNNIMELHLRSDKHTRGLGMLTSKEKCEHDIRTTVSVYHN